MTPEEWNELIDLFHTAREKSGIDRDMFLDEACGEDVPLRKAVEELLREDFAAHGFLSEPLFRLPSSASGESVITSGQHIGRYITISQIGLGGMGEVWSAQDTVLDRRVALKFLSSKIAASFDPQQIIREAKAASALNHPGIVTIYEVVQFQSTTALVMELVEGKPLRELCGEPMPVTEVVAIALQIAEALGAAHAHGTVHGDIKPENIILRSDQYIKLLDFGLARQIKAEKMELEILAALGTLRYMSPEQARGEALMPASDIFSFGLVLYELLAGKHAFPSLVPIDTARGIQNRDAEPPSSVNANVPARMDLLVRSMLAKDPAARPTAAAVEQTLREVQKSGEVEPGRSPRFWLWAMAVLLLISVGLGVWRWRESRQVGSVVTFRQITTLIPENRATAAAISPDGRVAAYANVDGIFLRTLETGSTKALSAPNDFAVDRLAWFKDGTKLVASGFSRTTRIPSLWVISTSGEASRLLRDHAGWAIPSPDGRQVAFLGADCSEIWTVGTDGQEPRKVLTGAATDCFLYVLWSPGGHRLSFGRRTFQKLGYSYRYESVDLASGKVDVEADDFMVASPAMLPDGRLMFLKWDNDQHTTSRELWEEQTDAASGKMKGTPRKIATLPGNSQTTMLGLSAAATGRRAMVLVESSQKSVFVGDFDPHPPRIGDIRRLTLDAESSYPHTWSMDSRSVIFESDRNGTWDLFRQRLDQRTPEVITAGPGTEILPQLTPDGRSLLYAEQDPRSGRLAAGAFAGYRLMRVPVEGGAAQEVPIGGPLDEFRCAVGAAKRCVLRVSEPGKSRVFYDLDPVRGKGRELARTGWSYEILWDWDISPDGTEIAIPEHSSRDARIRVISLEPKPNQPQERVVALPGVVSLHGLVWAADGRGWFVSIDTTIGHQLLYATLDGKTSSLGDIQGWAVPSPDGRRVAFLNTIVATNAWLIELR
jgi:serine/threonine protein kinase